MCEKLVLVPGKLDHATIVAYTVEDRRQSLRDYREVLHAMGKREAGRDTFALLSLAFAQIFIVTQVSANAYHDGNIKMDFVRY